MNQNNIQEKHTQPQPSKEGYPISINPDIPIAELQEKHPDVIDFLVKEYGFHCASCFLSQFETLRDGAQVHMITGEYFDTMMEEINEIANKESSKSAASQ